MRRIRLALVGLGFSTITLANPVTPPEHNEKDFRSIGGGLFVRRDEDAEADSDGNTLIPVFSHVLINAGGYYSFDSPLMDGPSSDEVVYDAGSLGHLKMQQINIDCAHQTYEVYDKRKPLHEGIWRPASTLPALAPIFRYACVSHSPSGESNSNRQKYTPTADAEQAPPVVTSFPLTDAALRDIAGRMPSAADKIKTFCQQPPGQDENGFQENRCRENEIAAWKSLLAAGRFQYPGAATVCPSPPFPNDFVGEEACLKYKSTAVISEKNQ